MPSRPIEGISGRIAQVLQGAVMAVLAGTICCAPRVVPWVLTTLALLYLAPHANNARMLARQALSSPTAAATLLLPFLGVLSTIWSSDRRGSFETACTVVLLAFVSLFLLRATRWQMRGLSPAWQRRFLRAVPIGGLAGLGFLTVEALSGNAVTRRVLTMLPVLTGERGKGLKLDAGQVTDIAGYFINRNVAGLTLLAIPLVLAIWFWLADPLRKVVIAITVVCLVVVVFRSESETAKLALILGTLAIVAAHRWPQRTLLGLAGALTVALLFTLTLARVPLYLHLEQSRWLAQSHRDRVLIWDANADIAARHPFVGSGVEASRALQQDLIKRHMDTAKQGAQVVETRRPAWHAHNFYLQTRVDLGFAGSLAALAFGLAMIAGASRLHPTLVPWAAGLVAATMASAISGWGLWQYWFLAGLAADVVYLGMIDEQLRQKDASASPRAAP